MQQNTGHISPGSPLQMNLVLISTDELTCLIQQSIRTELANNPPVLSRDERIPLNVDEAAQYLGVPKATLYQFTRLREVPHKKVGKRLVFLSSELDAWISSKKQKTRAEIESESLNLGKKGGNLK